MNAGKLRHWVTVYTPPLPSATDSLGDPLENYTAGASFWASIEPLSAREILLAHQVRADITHKFTCRYRTDVASRYQIQWAGRTFELGPRLSTEERGFDMTFLAIEKRQ